MQCWQGSSSSHQESLPPRPLVYRAPEGGSFDFLLETLSSALYLLALLIRVWLSIGKLLRRE